MTVVGVDQLVDQLMTQCGQHPRQGFDALQLFAALAGIPALSRLTGVDGQRIKRRKVSAGTDGAGNNRWRLTGFAS